MSNPLFRILLFFLAGWPGACLYAQLAAIDLPDPALTPQPAMILLGGLSPEVGGEHYRTVFLSTEHPFNPYHHIGLQYTYFLPKPANTYGNRSLEKGGYDLGLYSKFFLHGRLSGRISNLYLSPQLRIGRKNRRFYELYTGGPILYNVQEKTTKYLICLGGQYQRGHAVLEWSFPFGINRVRTTGTDPIKYSESQNQNLYLAPGIALGFRW